MNNEPNHDHSDDKTRTHAMLTSGMMVAQYRIDKKIGAGGMGEVYLAEDTRLRRKVALKFLPVQLMPNRDIHARFVREAQTLAKLSHPNIVSIFDVNDFDQRPFYAMELVEGEELRHYCHQKSLPIETIVEYAIQICQGLGEAHRAGVIHRDVKSTNIIVAKNGRVHLIDFGLARYDQDDKLTKTGSTLGTVAYMSPEQVSGRDIDHRSDLFSLGVVLYELLTGRTPFKRDNEGATLKAIMEDVPDPLSRYKSGVPEKLQSIVTQLLEKDKELRYQSAEGVIADLKKLVYDSHSTPGARAKRRPVYRRPLTWMAAAAVFLIVIAGTYFYRSSGEAKTPVLAVLPFTNIGSDEDQYFSEGITDEIRSRLSTLEGVRILSRASVEKYRGSKKSAEEIGKELNADYLLEGTIRWDKSSEIERLRITPQLTQTKNDYQLWSENYQRTVTEIFAIQSEIADQIARQLGVTFDKPSEVRDPGNPTDNVEAYNYYLKGLEITRQGIFNNVATKEAMTMFDSAIALDSSFALAWAQKSKAASEHSFAYLGASDTLWMTAKKAASKSLELDPGLVEGHIALGTFYNFGEQDFDLALTEFGKSEKEVSTNADLSEAIGIVLMRRGEWSNALSRFEQAAHLDPLNTRCYYWLAMCSAEMRDFSKANQYINRSFTLAPDNDDAIWLKVFINLVRSGKVEFGEYKYSNITEEVGVARASMFKLSMANTFGLWRFLPKKYISEEMIKQVEPLREKLPDFDYWCNISELYRLLNKPELSRTYVDSAKTELEEICEVSSHDFHIVGKLALTYARLGEVDKAADAGRRAKELMSVDDCHW